MCRTGDELPGDGEVGMHPRGGDMVEAPGSPAGERRKCRGVGAGPAPRPLLLAELLPPPAGRAGGRAKPERARRGAAGRTGPDEAQREAAPAGGGAGSGGPGPPAQRGALGSVPRAAARR